MEEVKAHCETCCDNKDETSEVQAGRIRDQRRSGDRLVAWSGRKVEVTVDNVLHARWKMMENKANGPRDCLVTEMMPNLPMVAVLEAAHCFAK